MNVNEVVHGLEPLPQELSIDSCPIDSNPSAGDFYLRVLPLGASIVWGIGSTTGNGFVFLAGRGNLGFSSNVGIMTSFRKPLRDALRQAGWDVNMVGSQNHGDMVDSVSSTPIFFWHLFRAIS